ncbi:unnamed protein product [Orchesella dallaii]|uniref:Uncharacterized protein n=1 Tax=Orchesella dallaii TaxID=48710 RepID=A0ABP1QVT2_9HEXA
MPTIANVPRGGGQKEGTKGKEQSKKVESVTRSETSREYSTEKLASVSPPESPVEKKKRAISEESCSSTVRYNSQYTDESPSSTPFVVVGREKSEISRREPETKGQGLKSICFRLKRKLLGKNSCLSCSCSGCSSASKCFSTASIDLSDISLSVPLLQSTEVGGSGDKGSSHYQHNHHPENNQRKASPLGTIMKKG